MPSKEKEYIITYHCISFLVPFKDLVKESELDKRKKELEDDPAIDIMSIKEVKEDDLKIINKKVGE